MVEPKTQKYTKTEVEIAEIAKALSHPARIKILKILNELDSCMVGSIVDLLPLSQSTVSQHLKELKRVGLIKGEIDGPKVCYCIDADNIGKAMTYFNSLFGEINKCC